MSKLALLLTFSFSIPLPSRPLSLATQAVYATLAPWVSTLWVLHCQCALPHQLELLVHLPCLLAYSLLLPYDKDRSSYSPRIWFVPEHIYCMYLASPSPQLCMYPHLWNSFVLYASCHPLLCYDCYFYHHTGCIQHLTTQRPTSCFWRRKVARCPVTPWWRTM